MDKTKHESTATHLRIYDSDGLIAAFSVEGDAVTIAAELFNKYVGVKNE